MKTLTIAFHGHCNDGMGAAIIANSVLDKTLFKDIKYTPMVYRDEEDILINLDTDQVLFLDYCPKNVNLIPLLERGVDVLILDHHIGAIDDLVSIELKPQHKLKYWITTLHCGTSLMHHIGRGINQLLTGDVATTPPLVINPSASVKDAGNIQYIADYTQGIINTDNTHMWVNLVKTRDIWDESDPEFKQYADEYAAGFQKQVMELFEKDAITSDNIPAIDDITNNIVETHSVGKSILEEIEKQCRHVLDNESLKETINGVSITVGIVTSNHHSKYGDLHSKSNEGNTLAVAVSKNEDTPGMGKGLGLRSKGDFPWALTVAKALGGGGHSHAAGAGFEDPKTPKEVLEIVKEIVSKH